MFGLGPQLPHHFDRRIKCAFNYDGVRGIVSRRLIRLPVFCVQSGEVAVHTIEAELPDGAVLLGPSRDTDLLWRGRRPRRHLTSEPEPGDERLSSTTAVRYPRRPTRRNCFMKTPLLRLGATAITVLTLTSACSADADTSVGTTPDAAVTTTTVATIPATGFSLAGTITLQGDQITIPPNARMVVSLDDTSLLDAASVNITQQVYEGVGGFPLDYDLTWDTELEAGNTYSVSATITVDDRLVFLSTTAFDVPVNDTTMDFYVIAIPGVDHLSAEVLGISEDDARAHIEAAGMSARTMMRNGEAFAGTSDYRLDRVNLTIEDDVVTGATVG